MGGTIYARIYSTTCARLRSAFNPHGLRFQKYIWTVLAAALLPAWLLTEPQGLTLLNVDTGSRQVLSQDGWVVGTTASEDKLFILDGRQLSALSLDSPQPTASAVRVLQPTPTDLEFCAFSPDATRIAYFSSTKNGNPDWPIGGVWAANVTGNDPPRKLLPLMSHLNLVYLQWISEDTVLCATKKLSGLSPEGNSVVTVNVDTNNIRTIYSGGDFFTVHFALSHDRRRLAFFNVTKDLASTLYVVDIATGQALFFLENEVRAAGCLAWSPDDSSLCYNHIDGLSAFSFETGQARSLWNKRHIIFQLFWVTDDRIVAVESTEGQDDNVFVLDPTSAKLIHRKKDYQAFSRVPLPKRRAIARGPEDFHVVVDDGTSDPSADVDTRARERIIFTVPGS